MRVDIDDYPPIGARVHVRGKPAVVQGHTVGVKGTPCVYVGYEDGSAERVSSAAISAAERDPYGLVRRHGASAVSSNPVAECERLLALTHRVERDLWFVHHLARGTTLGDLRADWDRCGDIIPATWPDNPHAL